MVRTKYDSNDCIRFLEISNLCLTLDMTFGATIVFRPYLDIERAGSPRDITLPVTRPVHDRRKIDAFAVNFTPTTNDHQSLLTRHRSP